MWRQQCSYACPILLMLWCRFNRGTCWGHEWDWARDASKVFFNATYYFKILQWPLRAVAAAYGARASHGPHCHGPRLPSHSGGLQNRQKNPYSLSCLQHRFGLKYNQGIVLLGTMYGWSILNCAEARGFRSHHSYVFDTGFLPTAEDNDTYSGQYTPHRSYIPEDRLLHKHHHKVWLCPKWLLLRIIYISGCPGEVECFPYTRVTSSSLKIHLWPTGY